MEVHRRVGGAAAGTITHLSNGNGGGDNNGGGVVISKKMMYSNGGASTINGRAVTGGTGAGGSVLKKTLSSTNKGLSLIKNYNNNFKSGSAARLASSNSVSSVSGGSNRNGMIMSGSVNVKGGGKVGGGRLYNNSVNSELMISRYEDYGEDGDGNGSYYDDSTEGGDNDNDNGASYQDQDDYNSMMDYEGQEDGLYDDDYDNNDDGSASAASAYVIDNGNDDDDEYPDTLQFCEAQFDEGCLDDDEEARGLPPPPGRGHYDTDGTSPAGNLSRTRITTNECGIRIVESSTILEPEGDDDVEYDRYGDYGVSDNFIPMSSFIPSTKRSPASMYKTRKMRPEKAAAEAILRQLRNSDLDYKKSNILAKKLMGVPSQAVQPSRPPPLTKKPATTKLMQQQQQHQLQAPQISLESILRQKQRPQQVQISSRPKSNSLLLSNTQLKIKSSHAIPPTTSISLSTIRQQPTVSNKSLSRQQQSNDSLPSSRLQPTQPSSSNLKSSLIRSSQKIQNFQQFQQQQQANTQFRARSQQGTEGASNNIPRLSISSIHQQIQTSQKNGLSMKPLKNVPRCNVCNRTFATNQVLQRHMVLHGPVATYTESDNGTVKCDVCFEEFESTGQLAKHIQLVHSNSEGPSAIESSPPSSSSGQQGLHRCRVCYRTFTSMESLNSHSVLHEGNLKCRACRRGFSDINSLEEHEATHKRYSCQWCTKYFMNSGNLKAHERIHTGERPYRCNDCPKAFKQLGGLQYHLKTNPTHKPQKYHKGELDGTDPGNNGSTNGDGDSNNSASGSAANAYIDPSMLQYESGEEYDDEGDMSILDLAAGSGF